MKAYGVSLNDDEYGFSAVVIDQDGTMTKKQVFRKAIRRLFTISKEKVKEFVDNNAYYIRKLKLDGPVISIEHNGWFENMGGH